MLYALREVQIPLVAAMLLGACVAKFGRALRTGSMDDGLGPTALFPMRLGPPDLRHESEDFYVGYTLDSALQALLAQARLELTYVARHDPRKPEEIDAQATAAVRDFAAELPQIRRLLDSDARFFN